MNKIRCILTSLLLLAGLAASAQQEVIIRINRKTNPLPPDVSSYMVKPAQYFNIAVTNPLDEPVDVYFGVRLTQLSTIGDDSYAISDIYTPDNVMPPSLNYVMTLLPSTTKVLNPMQIDDMFKWYNSSDITGLDGILRDLGGNAIGLLPEGKYRVTLNAFNFSNGALVSNPDLSWCEFDIRYNADPPQFIQVGQMPITAFTMTDHSSHPDWRPDFAGLPLIDLNLNKENNWFKWAKCTMSDINPVPRADYRLEIYRLHGISQQMSLDEIGDNKSYRMDYWESEEAGEKYLLALNDFTKYPKNQFFAARVVATPKGKDPSTANYMTVKNHGASPWVIIYNTDGTVNGDDQEDPGSTAIAHDDEETANWRIQLSYPNIKVNGKDNENNGFVPRYLTADKEGNLNIEWDKPTKVKHNESDASNANLFDKLEFTYDVGIYKIPEESGTDLEEILKTEPLTINKDVKPDKDGKLKTTLKYDDIAKKIEFYTNYIFVVQPKVAKPEMQEGEVIWTGAGNNCYTFAFLLTHARDFKGCNEGAEFSKESGIDLSKGYIWKEIPDEIKSDEDQKVELFVGNVDSEKAFSLRFMPGVKRKKALKDMKDGEASQFSGDCIVQWNPTIGGKKLYVNILCVLKDAEFNSDGQMVAGTCKSKERTDADWIPYNLINFVKMKGEGLFDGVDTSNETARQGAVAKWINDRFDDAGEAIQGGLAKAMTYATSPEGLKKICGSYYDRVVGYGQGASDIYSLLDACFEKDLKSQPITLPMRFPPDLVEKIHTDISLMSMEFTPIGASMDAMMLFNMPGGEKFDYDSALSSSYEPWKEEHPDLFQDEDGNPLEGDKLEEAEKKAQEQHKKEFEENYADIFGGAKGEEKNNINASGISYSKVLSFVMTDMCVEQGRLWSDTGNAALALDMDIHDTNNNFYFSFKAPKDPNNIKNLDSMDGCSFRWEKMGSEDFSFKLGLAGEFRIPDLLNEDGKENVKVGFGFVTDDWDDFTCELHMDSFRVPDAEDYLFRPGKILWDHSTKSNPAGLKFPKEFAGEKGYDWSKYFVGQGYENITFEEGTADIRWQGLYIEDIGVEFPGAISIDETYDNLTFDEDMYEYDEEGNIKVDEEGNQVIRHNAGDKVLDSDGNEMFSDETSTSFISGEERKFAVGLSNLIFDKTGVTLCGGLKNVFEAKTGKMGGWSISIDDVHFNVIQSNFRGCGFNGKVKIPLLSDYINYNCDISIQTKQYLDQNVHLYSRKTDTKVYDANQKLCHLVFKTSTPKNTNFDFFLGKAWIDERGSWLKVEYLPGHGTDVELMMSGTITLGSENDSHTAGKVSAIPFSIPGVRFTGLRIANFSANAEAEMADPNDPKKKTKTDYATKYATEWANEHKDEIVSMGSSYLNQLIKGSDLAVSSNANDKEKTEAAQTWGKYIAEAMKSREVDLSTSLTNGSKIDAFFSMGDWSFASAEKSFYGFDYNLGGWNFGIETKDKGGNDLEKNNVIVKFGFTGGISLLQKAKTTTTTINSDGTATTTTDVAADQKQQGSETMTQNADGSTTITKQSGGNELAASVGLTLRAKVKYSFSSISNWKLGFDGVDVDSLKIDGSFGGGMVKVKGVMHFSDTDEKSGFDGSLTLGLMGQDFKVAGGCYDMKKNAEELEASSKSDLRPVYSDENPDQIDHWETRPTYKAIFFLASYDGKDSGIPIAAGVSLNALMGGFYYNYCVPDVDANDYDKFIEKLTGTPVPKYGAYGFAAGLGLKWGEAAAAITGKFSLLVGYNATEGRLGTFKMLGDVRGLKDALKAKACISYTEKGMGTNDPDREQHFNVSVTVDVTADMTDQLANFVGGKENLEKIKKTFTEDHKSGLSDLTNGEQDTKKEKDADADEAGNKNEASEADANEKGNKAAQESGSGFQANMGAHISLLVDIKSRPNDPDPEVRGTKWMVCIGGPEVSKRCSVTLIDLAVGKGDWRIWAKVYANAYLCFGNKLPGNGDLPELPATLKSFLDDSKVGGGGDTGLSKEGGKMAKLDAQRQEAVDAMISGGASKGKANNGGVMFGMQAGADFGCRFGIGYVELGGLVGFDMVMKMMKDDCICLDEKGRLKPMGGKGGAYAEGQVYAYAYGRAGLILNLGFWSGDVDLMDMSVGAVLKGGFPNPTWAYGKLKAKGSLFGGLIKFNKKIEMKMGQVCMPLTGNPLDNIDIISEASFGYDNEGDGYDPENAVDCGAPLTFVTNMGIGEVLEILDEDLYQAKMGVSNDKTKSAIAAKGATRAFKFYVRSYAESSAGKQWAVRQTVDNTSFEVQTGIFEEKTNYRIELNGWCKELFIKDDVFVEEDPFIRDMKTGKTEQRPWGQEYLIYFNTAPYSDDMSKVARLVGPYDPVATEYDIKHPFVSLMYPLPQFGTDGIEVFGDLEEEITAPNGEKHLILPDQLYSDDGQYRRLTSTNSKYQGIRMRQYIEEGVDRDGNPYKYITVLPMNQSDIDPLKIEPGHTYRWTFYEMNMAGLNKLRGGIESTYEKLSSGDTSALLELQNNEEVQQWLQETGNDNMAAELLREYQDAGNEFNANEMESRVNSISTEAYSRGSSFRTEILSFETQCAEPLTPTGYGGYVGYGSTFREQMEQRMRTTATYERLLYSRKNPDSSPTRLTGGGIYFKPIALRVGDNPDQLDIYRNPYHRLWWWNWKAMYARSNKVGNAMTPRLISNGIDVYFRDFDYYENGETMRMSMKGGHRLKQSATDASAFMFVSREDAKVTFQQFAEWFNVFGSNRWCTPVKNDFKEYLKTVQKAYNADCAVAYNLDDDIHEVYATLVGSQEYKSGQNEVDYGKGKVDGAKRFEVYSEYLMLAQEKKSEEDVYEGMENTYYGTTLNRIVNNPWTQNGSWVSYPAWQVGAMYMTSRYYLTPNRMGESGFSASKYENTKNHMKQFLRPWDFINNTYTYYDQATSDELRDNLSGARGFEGGAPVTLEFLLLRPNRYNVLGQTNNDGETLDVSTWMPSDYQVSRGEQADRIVFMRTDLEGNNASVSSVFENEGAGGVLFSDPTVETIVKKYLGKDVVAYADLKDVKEFTYPAGYNEIKSFDDFYNFPNLEKFTWAAPRSIENLTFEGNPKLRELVIEDCKYFVDIDFSTCPNLERLVITTKDTEPWYYEKNNIKLLKVFPTIHLKNKPDLTKLPLLKRIKINYAEIDEIDLSNCAYLEIINFQYTNVGAKDIVFPNNPQNVNPNDYENKELYVFDLTKQKNASVYLGHQLAMWNGYLVRPTEYYLRQEGGWVDSSLNWNWVSWDYDGRNVFVRVTDPMLYSSFVSGGWNAEPSVRVITPDGTTSVNQVKEDLSDLDVNLRKLIFAEFGKAKTDSQGKPLTSSHTPNEIEYWTDLYTISLNDLKSVHELDASGCSIESLDRLQFYMPSLRKLDASDNLLISVDLTPFKELTEVDLSGNRLNKFDIGSANSGITKLDFSGNRLLSFDLAKLPNLTELNCSNNSLYQVDLSNASKLTRLDCGHNNLGDIDIRTCPALKWLDCSYNQMRSAPTKFGVTILFDETANDALTTLIASHVNTEDWPMCQVQDMSRLGELNLSGNAGLQSVTVSKRISKINVSDTPVDVLYYSSPNGADRVLSDNRLASLKELDAHNSNFGRSYTNRTVSAKNLDRLDISECYVDVVNVTGSPEIYVGQQARTGKRIAVAYDNDAGLSRWDLEFKNHPKNANAYAFRGSINSADVQEALSSDVVDENMVRLRNALGTELYNYIKADSTLAAIPEAVLSSTRVIDGRPYGRTMTDLKFVVNEFPKLEELYLSQNRLDDNAFDIARGFNKVVIVNPYSQETPETLLKQINGPKVAKGSLFVINNYVLKKTGNLDRSIFYYETVDYTGCRFGNADDYEAPAGGGTNKRFTADDTNLKHVCLYADNKLNYVSLRNCQDLQTLRVNSLGKLKPDSLILDGCGPEIRMIFANPDEAKIWVNDYMPKYPDIKFKFTITVTTKANNKVEVPLPELDLDLIEIINLACEKAKNLDLQNYKPSAPTVTGDEFIRKLLPTDEAYMNTWRLIGRYPDGLSPAELRASETLDISGAHHTAPRVIATSQLYNLVNLIATNSAFDCKTFDPSIYLRRIDFTNNPSLEQIEMLSYHCTKINVSRTSINRDMLHTLMAKTDTVIANSMCWDGPQEITVASDAQCRVLELDGNNISTINLDKTLYKFRATNISGDGLVIYATASLSASGDNFVIDNSANVKVRTKRDDVISRWFSTYANKYPNVVFEIDITGTGVYVPISSKSDADIQTMRYANLYRAFPDGWADLEVIDLRGDVKFSMKNIDQLLLEATKAWKLITGNNITEKNPSFRSSDGKMRVLDLRGYDNLESVYLWDDYAEGSEIILDGNTKMLYPHNIFQKIETVSANGCSSLGGTISVSAYDIVNSIDLGGTKVGRIDLDKHIASLKADKMLCDTLGVRFTGRLDDVSLALDKARLTSVILDREGVSGWFDKYAGAYPSAKVYVRYNGKDIPVTSFADYEEKILGAVGKYLRIINKNMPEVNEDNLDEVTELNIRGAGADDDFFNFMAAFMPNAHTIIADAPGSLKGNEYGAVNIPVTQTPIREVRADGCAGVADIQFGFWEGDPDDTKNSTISISGTEVGDISNNICFYFGKVIARNCAKLRDVNIYWGHKAADLDLSGSAIENITIEREIDRLALHGLSSGSVKISTQWLPDNPADFDVSDNADVTIEFWNPTLISKWFETFAPVYPGVKIYIYNGAEPIIITSADEYLLMPLFERNPGVNAANLASQKKISLDNCPEVNDLLPIVYERCKNLNELSLARNYSWMPEITYDRNITLNLGDLETPKTLFVVEPPRSGKILLAGAEKLTVRFADFPAARSWNGNRYAAKYPDAKYIVDVIGKEIVTRDINLVLYLMTSGKDLESLTTLDIKGYRVEPDVVTELIETLPSVVSVNAPSNSVYGAELTLPALSRKYKKVDLSGNTSLATLNMEGVAEPQVSSLDITGTGVTAIGPLARAFHTVKTDLGKQIDAVTITDGEVRFDSMVQLEGWFANVTDLNGVTTYYKIDGNYVEVVSMADAYEKVRESQRNNTETTTPIPFTTNSTRKPGTGSIFRR